MSSSLTPSQYPPVKLPHPFLTTYRVCNVDGSSPARFVLKLDSEQPPVGKSLSQSLHLDSLSWIDLSFKSKDQCPPASDNSFWARACRSPHTVFQWTANNPPSLGQIWNVIHAIYLAYPTYEYFRLSLLGAGEEVVRRELLSTGLGIEHPKQWHAQKQSMQHFDELLILRSSFWQGAASPMGPRPIWALGNGTDKHLRQSLSQYPINPENYQFTMKFPEEAVYTRHPIRRPKPSPGSIVYSRYIPELDEHFSLEVVNWQDQEHLELFNTWQNDPRVAKGWNETGTLEQHREYLRKLRIDPHVLCLFGRFNESRFAYFELYWSKVHLSLFVLHLLSGRCSPANYRKIIMALITTLEIMIVGATHLLVMHHSGAPNESTHGILVVSIIAFWMTRAPSM